MTATWQDVPRRVAILIKEAAPIIHTLRKVLSHLPVSADPSYGTLYWHPQEKTVWASLSDGDDQSVYNKYHNALKALQGVKHVRVEAETPPKPRDEWMTIKRACAFGITRTPFTKEALTSPNALATTLGGSLALGAGGYALGAGLEHLFPERFVQRGRLRKTLGMVGAGVGAVPGLWAAGERAALRGPDGQQIGWGRGLWDTPHAANSFQNTLPIDQGLQREMDSYDTSRGNGAARPGATPPAPPSMMEAQAALRAYVPDDWMAKAAENFGPQAGGGALPTIPLDAFGQAIWNDTRNYNAAQYNPYGSKSQWGANEQNMGTPPPIAAAASGLISGIGAQYGNPSSLSPRHFINGLATAGVDASTAYIAGGILGALGGLQPAAQQQLQNMGLWGGLVRGVVGSVFGR